VYHFQSQDDDDSVNGINDNDDTNQEKEKKKWDKVNGNNRDIDYLLTLCESIGLWVLAAPGPYICAETQCGGFPIWLAAKRNIRLRHMSTYFWKKYDSDFMEYCAEYFKNILP